MAVFGFALARRLWRFEIESISVHILCCLKPVRGEASIKDQKKAEIVVEDGGLTISIKTRNSDPKLRTDLLRHRFPHLILGNGRKSETPKLFRSDSSLFSLSFF